MTHAPQVWLLSLAILLLTISAQNSQAHIVDENGVKSSTFLSPKFELDPGSVGSKFYYDVEFPRGHIAIKNFNAEVVDEAGNAVPLHETYLHHWTMVRYYQREGVEVPKYTNDSGFHQSDFMIVKNAGLCDHSLLQYFGLGSETRRTATHVPDPYGIEVGNKAEIPIGFEEQWFLNVHAIDTRGAEDRLGCTECRCDLYNVTKDEYGRPMDPNYVGGLRCCRDGMRCRVRDGIESDRRGLYMKYTVEWVDWDNSIVPVKIYIFDVTDKWRRLDDSTGHSTGHDCQTEYEVDYCAAGVASNGCTDTKKVSLSIPTGGDVIYAVAHQHTGGIGSALYREDRQVICSSIPIYGEGSEAGNEAGYIVGMSTCYPRPGSIKISDRETLILESNYSSSQRHTGVMGLFYIIVAEPSPKPSYFLHSSVEMHANTMIPKIVWVGAFFGVAIAIAAAVVTYRRWNQRADGYESILM